MDIEAARFELNRALNSAAHANLRFRAAIAVLADCGTRALSIAPGSGPSPREPGPSLDAILRIAAEAPPTEARRAFAVLLVHAIAVPGLLPARGETARLIQSCLEHALLNPLRRAGYPFDGPRYDKRQALEALHATIDEHLHPLEPSIPRWIHGIGSSDED
jgi:hypothetical protein